MHPYASPLVLIVTAGNDLTAIYERNVRTILRNAQWEVVTIPHDQVMQHVKRRFVPFALFDAARLDSEVLEVVRLLRADSSETRIAYTTPYDDWQSINQIRAAGVHHFFSVPFPLDELERVVNLVIIDNAEYIASPATLKKALVNSIENWLAFITDKPLMPQHRRAVAAALRDLAEKQERQAQQQHDENEDSTPLFR